MSTLQELITELNAATLELSEASDRHREALRQHTAATNRVNEAQKMIDAEIARMKKASPAGTDWRVKDWGAA